MINEFAFVVVGGILALAGVWLGARIAGRR